MLHSLKVQSVNSGVFWAVPTVFPLALGSSLTPGLLAWWMTLWHYFGPERHCRPAARARAERPFSVQRKRRQDRTEAAQTCSWNKHLQVQCFILFSPQTLQQLDSEEKKLFCALTQNKDFTSVLPHSEQTSKPLKDERIKQIVAAGDEVCDVGSP